MKRGYVTPGEYAARHGCHINSVMKWIHAGRLPSVRISQGKRFRYLVPCRIDPPRGRPGPPPSADARMSQYTRLLLRTARSLRIQADTLDAAGLLPNPRERSAQYVP